MLDRLLRRETRAFYLGVFVVAACILALQIVQTRLLSVVSWYSFAFLAISMAMFGMTIGSLIVYFRARWFEGRQLSLVMAEWSVYFALAIFVCWTIQLNMVVLTDLNALLTLLFAWLPVIIVLALPYIFGGVLIALALTRSRHPVGEVYAADLIGAAAGCFVVLITTSVMDSVSAMLLVAALAGAGGMLFRMDAAREAAEAGLPTPDSPIATQATRACVLLAALALTNAMIYPAGARLLWVKGDLVDPVKVETIEWNSFSRIDMHRIENRPPLMMARSSQMPDDLRTPFLHREMRIDGAASSHMYRFEGDREEMGFLEYDLTSLAYFIRNEGRSAIIGVGGGRDLLAAHYFGFDDITGVELNPIFIRNLEERYRDFNALADLPGVKLHVDDARAWFARSDETFDVIQMSLIDTWAATGVGAYSLSENGLYTIEGWKHFLGGLSEDGVFTVSRWFLPENPGETGRIASLAKATLYELGAEDPNAHIVLATNHELSTIIVGRQPLSESDIATLKAEIDRLDYGLLMAPGLVPEDPVIASIASARSTAELNSLAADALINFAPPTDDSPFFFNQLKFSALADPVGVVFDVAGVVKGNIIATMTLMLIILISAAAVLLTAILPTFSAVTTVDRRLATLGTFYFAMIGLGFMFVEIAFMQRLSVFLGHPVYGLAIALAGIILATGIGSLVSERVRMTGSARLVAWAAGTAAFVASVPFWLPGVLAFFSTSGIFVRGLVSLIAIAPAGLLMGFGFPTGMRLVSAIDDRATPWFWAVNGAAGVLASGSAIAVATFVSISANFMIGAVCYALLVPCALLLRHLGKREAVEEMPEIAVSPAQAAE